MDPRYLKTPEAEATVGQANADIRRRVEQMLDDIESGGVEAMRRWSRELDGWDPERFTVTDEDFERAAESLDPELRDHIALAQEQVRGFAEAQRATLTDLEIETRPGIVLGHQHIPVGSVGAYVPGGRYPMLASSFMTIIVAKAAGVPNVIACAPPQPEGGVHPAMLYAMRTSGADHVIALGGVQALAGMAFGLIDDHPAVDML